MKQTHIHSAVKQASHDTSRFMSAHLRAEARNSGWPEHIARTMHVSYGDKGFTTHTHPDHRAAVLDLEYGTPGTQPTAAIRRFGNRTREAERFFTKRLGQYMGSLK